MPLSIDDIKDYVETNIEAWEEMYEEMQDGYDLGNISAYKDVLLFIDRHQDRQVKPPPREGAISPERIREACKKVNQRRSK